MGGSLQAGSDHLQYTALRRVFNILLFLYLFDEKCESVLSTFFSIKMIKKEGELASYSRV